MSSKTCSSISACLCVCVSIIILIVIIITSAHKKSNNDDPYFLSHCSITLEDINPYRILYYIGHILLSTKYFIFKIDEKESFFNKYLSETEIYFPGMSVDICGYYLYNENIVIGHYTNYWTIFGVQGNTDRLVQRQFIYEETDILSIDLLSSGPMTLLIKLANRKFLIKTITRDSSGIKIKSLRTFTLSTDGSPISQNIDLNEGYTVDYYGTIDFFKWKKKNRYSDPSYVKTDTITNIIDCSKFCILLPKLGSSSDIFGLISETWIQIISKNQKTVIANRYFSNHHFTCATSIELYEERLFLVGDINGNLSIVKYDENQYTTDTIIHFIWTHKICKGEVLSVVTKNDNGDIYFLVICKEDVLHKIKFDTKFLDHHNLF